MSDYEKLKATELKTLLKDRGIAATGLTKKAQYIQALIEEDERTKNDSAAAGDEAANGSEAQAEAVEEAEAEREDRTDAQEEQKADVKAIDTQGDVVGEIAEQESAGDEKQTREAAEKTSAEVEEKLSDDSSTAIPGQALSLDRKRKRDVSAAIEEHDSEGTPKKARAENDNDEPMPDASVAAPVAVPLSKRSSSSPQHEPTAALYIRNLMRPLQLSTLSDYLVDLAGSPIARLHLDGMKTHAFAVFESTEAATSVRDQLHNRVWPEESQRKLLWIDFVPEDQVHTWIDKEDKAGRDTRFEVTYTSDGDGAVEASLVELNARSSQQQQQQQQQQPRPAASPQTAGQGMPGAPQGPRGHRAPERGPTRDAPPPEQSSKPPQQEGGGTFSKLDQYFSFTTAKPKIYFKPVDKELADARFAEFDRETSRDWQGGRAWNRSTRLAPIDQLRRYTFEDGDKIVDGGVDFGGFGKRQFAGGTGPFIPGGPGGPSRGRGGRGGGGGYRGGY